MQSQLASERQQQLMRIAHLHEVVRVSDAAKELGVHEMTIRRDLNDLAEQGLLERVHGGARLPRQASAEVSFNLRLRENLHEKDRIAKEALRFIQQGDTVVLDASTTSLAVAQKLSSQDINVIVTNLESANALAHQGVRFFLAGGEYHDMSRSFVGANTLMLLERFRPDVVFFSAKGFSIRAGFSDAYLPEASIKEQLIKNARRVVALIDHSKFGEEALYSFASIQDVHHLITDAPTKQDVTKALQHENVDVIIAP